MGDMDYTDYFTAIIEKQEQELETLTYTNELLKEEINGLTMIVNYQEMFFEMFAVLSVILLVWKMLSKWFFGGV